MKFSDLPKKSQTIAAQIYLEQWLEKNPRSDLKLSDCIELLEDSDDEFYKSGVKKDENM